MTEDSEPNEEPNVDPEDLPDDGGVEVEKGYGSNKNGNGSDGGDQDE
jgi:hypothetical protein